MIAGLLLAAGGASRFGSQKLVAPFHGESLVRHAAKALIDTTDAVTAVVGNDAKIVQAALNDLDVAVVINPEWQSGLASSLRCGIGALPANAEAVVIALGDQPLIDPAVIRRAIARWHAGGCEIVAARYAGVQGHPVLFSRALFDELQAVDGDRGAKRAIERVPDRVAFIDVETPAPRDVDTRDDLATLGG